ncbi:MAG: PIN domain-containing protein [Elusimicrobia bacterium]|nr:PIN domain-containing protein [Elusimicrobiota bacterium]
MKNKPSLIDTNVIVRYLVEDPNRVDEKFKGVFSFFPRVEAGEISVELPELVLFEVFFVLTKLYHVPPTETARRLAQLLSYRGLLMRDKPLIKFCLRLLQQKPIGLVDAYLVASAHERGNLTVYSFDRGLSKQGIRFLQVE